MIPVSALREQLNLPRTNDPDGQQDDLLLAYRNAAVAHIERETAGRYFGPLEQVTRTLTGAGYGTLWLPDEIAAVTDASPYPETVEELAYYGATATEIATSGFVVSPPDRLFRTGGSVWTRGLLYDVTYWRGYPVGGLPVDEYRTPKEAAALYLITHESYLIGAPADVLHAVRLLVAHWFTSRLPIGPGSITEELSFSLRGILDSRRYLFV